MVSDLRRDINNARPQIIKALYLIRRLTYPVEKHYQLIFVV
jgi:hypothetical protein